MVSILLIRYCSMRVPRLGPDLPCGTAIRAITFPMSMWKLRKPMPIMATSYIGITPAMNSNITPAIPPATMKPAVDTVTSTIILTTPDIGTWSYPPSF